ncbi:Annexin [Hypoxylon sp. FL1150]|nr:Annexin [Hypoxylon sp. FL1150]
MAFYTPIDTSADVKALREAMEGMGCDEAALVRVLTSAQYENPWAMAQLVTDYNRRFNRDLTKDIESETRGDLETALFALVRGPLVHDVAIIFKALECGNTDPSALMDVLLCRTNADIRAITFEYNRARGHELVVDIRKALENSLFRLYSMALVPIRADDLAPVIDIDQEAMSLQHATEGIITASAKTVIVTQIFASLNAAQMRALDELYLRKYRRSLEEVIKKEFNGDLMDALLYILVNATDQPRLDAKRLEKPLYRRPRNDRLFITKVVSLYWDRTRLEYAKAAFQRHSLLKMPLRNSIQTLLSEDCQDLILALIHEKI